MSLIKSISGIRGTIGGKAGDSLSPLDVVKFTAAYGAWLKTAGAGVKVIIGRDARPSGELISRIVASTLQSLGFDVIDLGLTTTPTVEITIPIEEAAGGIVITASHNPIQWNALKLLNNKGEFISEDDGNYILNLSVKKDIHFVEVKKLGQYSIDDTYLQKHVDAILQLPLVNKKAIEDRNFNIAIDCVNSSGSVALPLLLEALGVKRVTKFYCEPNGMFPHNPEPLPENLAHISNEMAKGNFDVGIVVDPDVDRLCFVNEDGSMFGEEYTLVSVADYILKNTPGPTVSNLSSTRALKDITKKAGQEYFASAVGEVNVVKTMKETGAVIGGEGNGGIIYPELHYGRDALVGIALFLSQLAIFGKSVSMLRSKYPSYHISKNKIELTSEVNVDLVLEEIKDKYKKQPINDIDGIKIEFDNDWVHLRKSNTEPIIRIYSESDTHATSNHLANKLITDIKEIISRHVFL